MLNYLFEFRRRSIYIILVFGALFGFFFFFANHLFYFFAKPLILALPGQKSLIATDITAPLLTPIRLAADAALLLTTPFALFQFWQFVAPGLYRQERHHLKATIVYSVILFLLGVLFCFYLILPFMFQFFAKALPQGVQFMPDMTTALDFITHMLLIFGLCFQLPLFSLLLVRLNWVSVEQLKKVRPYVIVAAFVVGMFLTPPDVFSQLTLALPLCFLYELGIVFARFYKKDLITAHSDTTL